MGPDLEKGARWDGAANLNLSIRDMPRQPKGFPLGGELARVSVTEGDDRSFLPQE